MGAWSWPPRAELDILEKPDWHGFNIDLDVRAAVRGGRKWERRTERPPPANPQWSIAAQSCLSK
jgi:hypothetical protein